MLRRPLLTLSSLVLAAGLTACSGDDSSESPSSDSGSTAGTSPSGEAVADKERGCTATVEVTGATESTYEGDAKVLRTGQTDGPAAIFMASWDKKTQLNIYAAGGDFDDSAVLSIGGTNYSTDPETEGLEVDAKSKTASVDTELAGTDGSTVTLVADVSCTKPGKTKN